MEGDFIEEDRKTVPQSYEKIYKPIEGKIATPYYYSFRNFSFTGLSIRDLQTIKTPNENSKVTYALKKSGDKIIKTILSFKIDDIRIKDEYSDEYRIRFKKEILFKCIKSISFNFIEKRSQIITPIILKCYMNYFNDEMSKEEYNNIIGTDDRFVTFSTHIKGYECTIELPFFTSEDKSMSFPQYMSDYVPEYDMSISRSLYDIIEVNRMINGDWVNISSQLIKGKLKCKTKEINDPNVSICYGLLSSEEKQTSICGGDVDTNTEVYYKDFRELFMNKITNEDEPHKINNEDEPHKISLQGERCLGLIFYGPENYITSITCYTINKENKKCIRFENLTYSKSERFQYISFKRNSTIEKNRFIAISFCSDISSIDSQSIVDLSKYYFDVTTVDGELNDISCVGIFLDKYTISKNKEKIVIS